MDGQGGDEDFEKLPIEARLQHKSWKARLSAYTALINTFKSTIGEEDASFGQFSNVDGWLRDANAVAQEKGVEAACALIEYGGRRPAKLAMETALPAIVEKCLGSARAGTKNKAIELCLLFVEVDDEDAEQVIDGLSAGLDAKQPKVVAGAVTAIKDIIRLFGPKVVSPKPILRLLPKIFAHADKNVRAEGTQLALALHAYLGLALTPHLADLKPVQQKELGEAFDKADAEGKGVGSEEGQQKRFTRKQQKQRALQEAKPAVAETIDDAESSAPAEPEAEAVDAALDPYDLADPVQVLDKLPSDFWTHLASTKWKDRKELALEPLLAVLQTPRVAPGPYGELLSSLATRVSSDANVICVALAANAIEKLATGLRSDINPHKEAIIAPLLSRTKEKKQNVLDAIGAALDASVAYLPLGEVVELSSPFLSDKNPSVRLQTLLFLNRTLSNTPTVPSPASVQPFADQLVAAMADSVEANRNAAADALGTLTKLVGERATSAKIDSLDDVRKGKVREAIEKATTKAKPAGPAASKATAPKPSVSKPAPRVVANTLKKDDSVQAAARPIGAARPASPKKPMSPAPSAAAPRGPPARLMAKKPTAPAPSSTSAVKKPAAPASSGSKAAPPKSNEPIKYKYSQEDAEAQAEGGLLPAPLLAQIGEANWKARLEGMTALHDWVATGDGRQVDAEIVVRYLLKKPGPKESNFQVAAKVFGIFQALAERDQFDRAAAALSIPWLSDKLGDIKLKKPAGDALVAYAERSSLQFVLSQAYEPMIKQKAPKAQADTLVWIESVLREFGIAVLSIRDMIEFLKNGLKSANAPVRTNATKALVTLKLFVGADLSTFLQDLNPQLLATIESEFAEIASETAPAPTRSSADNSQPASASASGSTAGSADAATASEDPMDDLFPRVDLDKIITSSTISSIGDANWKVRKEALENVQSLLEQHKRFKQGPITDLVSALKARMTDANKVVQCLALDVIARIAAGTGKPFATHARTFAAPVAGVLADAKTNVRAAGTTTLSAMADSAGLDSMVAGFEKPLENTNPLLRKELLSWLQARFEDKQVVATLDVSAIVGPVISCLEDRSTDVRKPATALLPDLIARAGYNTVMDHVSKLKPASKSTVLPLVESARATAPKLPAAAASSAPVVSLSSPKPAATAGSSRAPVTSSTGLRKPTVSRIGAGNIGVAKSIRSVPVASSAASAPAEARAPASRPRASIGGLRAKATVANPVASTASTTKEPPFTDSDAQPKQMRAARETGSLRWQVDAAARPDQVDALQSQMTAHTSSSLLALLFSKDHNAERDYVSALTYLIECSSDTASAAEACGLTARELKARLVANVDVIFKYVTLRLTLTSTTVILKCLDLVDNVVRVLDEDGHRLSEYEASALLYSLIIKVGDGKDTIRSRVRHLFRAICTVYPFSKVFASMLDYGLSSKNPRARAECAEEIGHFFQQHGLTPFPAAKALAALGKLIGDKDNAVRTASLFAIGHAYSFVGADVYKMVGTLPPKERTLLDERLKRTTTAASSPRSDSRPSTPELTSASSANRESQSPREVKGASPKQVSPATASRIAKPVSGSALRPPGFRPVAPTASGSSMPPPSQLPAPRSRLSMLPQPQLQPASATRTVSGATSALSDSTSEAGPSSGHYRRMIREVLSSDMNESSEALKKLQKEIIEQPEPMLPHADLLVETVTKQMDPAFATLAPDSPHEQLRLCKHLMNVLTHFFDHKTLGQAISPPVLTNLIADLTGRLLSTADQSSSDAISSLSKVLNMVLIRIFHNADQGMCFTALLTILGDSTADLRDLRGDELAARSKYAELVMKCLWKVSKTVKESLESNQLAVSRLLRDINQFLSIVPPSEWRRRLNDNVPLGDMPLRTVKTILQQIVSVHGEQVFNELDEVPHTEESFVYQYLQRIVSSTQSSDMPRRASQDSALTNGKQAGSLRPPSSSASNRMASPALRPIPSAPGSPVIRAPNATGAAPMSPVTNGSDIDINHQLKVIFDRIGDPSESRAGIEDLYRFQKEHPEAGARVGQWMANTGKYFQTYLQRALDNLAATDREQQARQQSVESNASPLLPTLAQDDPATTGKVVPSATPRRSRLSMVGGSGATPSAAKLQELQNVFGFSSQE